MSTKSQHSHNKEQTINKTRASAPGLVTHSTMFTPVLRLTAVLCLAFGVATAKIQGDDCSIYSLNQCDGECGIDCTACWVYAQDSSNPCLLGIDHAHPSLHIVRHASGPVSRGRQPPLLNLAWSTSALAHPRALLPSPPPSGPAPPRPTPRGPRPHLPALTLFFCSFPHHPPTPPPHPPTPHPGPLHQTANPISVSVSCDRICV